MEKRILIAVAGSIYSRKTIEYTVKMESVIKDFNYILLNIQPKISEFLIEDARIDGKARSALKDVTSKNQENSIKILNESKSIMTKLGVDEKQIEIISQPVVRGTAKAILDYGTPSFKIFMVYDFRVDDATMVKLLEETKKYGGLVQVHAENVYIIQHMNEVLEKEGKLALHYHFQ